MLISILLATYNGEKYIAAQLDSLLAQSFEHFEIVVRDDCSTDNTVDIIKSYCIDYPTKIKLQQNEVNSGSPCKNFIDMIRNCSSEYIMTCDQDDVWFSEKVENSFLQMQKAENTFGRNTPILLHSDLIVTDEQLFPKHFSFFKLQSLNSNIKDLNHLLVGNNVTGCTMMINYSLASKVLTYCPSIVMHDWWCALIAVATGEIVFLNEPLVYYRQHSNNVIGVQRTSLKYPLVFLQNAKKMKCKFKASYQQAAYFLDCYNQELSVQDKKILYSYQSFSKISLFCKLFYVIRYSFWKSGFFKKMTQLLFM